MNNSRKHPYYIIAPRFVRTSGGVRTLYRLADLINKSGGSAFIFLWPYFNRDDASSPMDVAPFLTKKIADYHYAAGMTPIVIYPETFKVARFNPPIRVRYLLNYDELFVRNDPLEQDDFLLAYSQAIANRVEAKVPMQTLYLPVSDTNFFSPPRFPVKRSGAAFYAGKYKYHFGGALLPETDGILEITRDRRDSQSPEEIRDLFRRIEFFYSYEDTALALEAILCGCPVVFLPNKHFPAPLGASELKGFGIAWGASPEQMTHACQTVHLARQQHLARVEEVRDKVNQFIESTQKIAENTPYKYLFADGYLQQAGIIQTGLDLKRFITAVISDRGVIGAAKIVLKRLMSGRLRI